MYCKYVCIIRVVLTVLIWVKSKLSLTTECHHEFFVKNVQVDDPSSSHLCFKGSSINHVDIEAEGQHKLYLVKWSKKQWGKGLNFRKHCLRGLWMTFILC